MGFDKSMAQSFGPAADLYDSIRPTYPAEAVAWMTDGKAVDAVDLGAGTGLLTRALVAQGHRVTAVEPDDLMRTKLVSATEGIAAALSGSAEAIPVPDASADLVTGGQSFHWFDRDKAMPEIRRVLRPGGVLAPVWNVRDESTGWVGALTEAIGNSQGEKDALAATAPGYFGDLFGEVEYRVFRHEWPIDRAGVLRLVQSRSYYLTADAAGKARIEAVVGDVLGSHPDLEGRESFAMPYDTYVFRVRPV
ncbi:class I SAM-dependent methyltransferase [Glycomyces sp. NPDC048151]|uniref:class I SAM-dependent methyltransferase n=1 Tax=Glycomyces sp. NPDC048151 TaxID=3364002 RepID=UPI00371F5F41